MADHCLRILTDCAVAKRFAQAAQARAAAVFDYRAIVPQYEAIYERALGAPASRAVPS
jgi:hypothetical protein